MVSLQRVRTLAKLVRKHGIPPSCLVSADKCISHKIIRQDRHLEAMPREISGIVVVTNYEEV